ncbi:PREDICTED: nuclear hormone receptor FTZ-F1-like isoform X2 [Priapulus caudatus]|nr:PREDICTED: nuclear hormone receptor FTZ-F1-like isoform X2 [Priapulus caudatus]
MMETSPGDESTRGSPLSPLLAGGVSTSLTRSGDNPMLFQDHTDQCGSDPDGESVSDHQPQQQQPQQAQQQQQLALQQHFPGQYHNHQYPLSGFSPGMASAASDFTDAPDTKEDVEEACPVCGDRVSGYHYGLLTCESCKGFFKRTVQNKKVYTCVAEKKCLIDKTQRKRCPYCRFQKCLEVGMKLEAVRPDRMRGGRNKFGPMYKRERALKLQARRMAVAAQMGATCQLNGVVKSLAAFPSFQQDSKSDIQIPQLSSSTNSPDSSALDDAHNNNIKEEGAGGGGGGGGASAGSGAARESKLWQYYPTVTKVLNNAPQKVPQVIRELSASTIDDKTWQESLFSLINSQTYNQCEVDLFELMCKVLDHSLFSLVEWARRSYFFKDLKVEDQMKLLQLSWSELLILDMVYHQLHNSLPNETLLPNGQKFSLLNLTLFGFSNMAERHHELLQRLRQIKFDRNEYLCIKFIILLNPDVKGLTNSKLVEEAQEKVNNALMEYCSSFYPEVEDKFGQILLRLPELRLISIRGEEFLHFKHLSGGLPTQTLLMEMLHAKRRL